MGRGGGGGGGGRSSGGGSRGGSRSSGGHRGGGFSSGRGGRGSSSFSRPSSGGYGHGPHHHHHYHSGPGYYSRRTVVTGAPAIIITLIFVLVMAVVMFLPILAGGGSGGSITRSTVEREPLDATRVITTGYYEDNMGWVESGSRLERGMKHFFKETGVQPFLYLTETVDGDAYPSDAEMDAFASALYDELFEDEAHLLVVFQEYDSNGEYLVWTVAGKEAKVVVDNEALDMLYDYIDSYYTSELDTSDYFSTVFEKTADRMMTVTKSPLPTMFIMLGVVALAILGFFWWKKAKAQKNLEAAQTERILNADLGDNLSGQDATVRDLEDKYQ